ncbi:MAG: transglycosylase SLT domain-containing protein [Pseudomonadota bacterium]|nr:transglycosylase SLT domain-containing protein [Pseudomonadota bacterium]
MKYSLRKMILTIAGVSAVGLALSSCSAGAGSAAAQGQDGLAQDSAQGAASAAGTADEVGTSGQRFIPNSEVPAPVDHSITGSRAEAVDPASMSRDQILYLRVKSLLKAGQFDEARAARGGISRDYPLQDYLDFYEIYYGAFDGYGKAAAYIKKNDGTARAGDLESKYIRKLSNAGDYRGVLAVATGRPQDTGLACLYEYAEYRTGKADAAFGFMEKTFMKGQGVSVPDDCAGLFSAWRSSGKAIPGIYWTKLMSSIRARNQAKGVAALVSYLKGSSYEGRAQLAQKVYSSPSSFMDLVPGGNDHLNNSIVVAALSSMARTDTEGAAALLPEARTKYSLSESEYAEALRNIIWHVYADRVDSLVPWADRQLDSLHDADSLKELRIRFAIRRGNFRDMNLWIRKLTGDSARDLRWTYWKARALAEAGNQAEAERLYAKVTRERSFYGFMASQRLGKPLSFNDESPLVKKVTEEEAVRRWPEFARIHELLAVGDTLNAQREWRRFILAIPRNEKLEAAMLALDKGWFDFSVNASIYAKAWSVLSLRFPTPMLSFYRQRSRETGVPLSYLYAISRQESALNPFARSPVGAAGLMQLMPQTAANIAGKCGIAYSGKDALFDPEINVSFGSCYLMQLLEKYGGNRILASAAYNAGPGRVTKWTDSDGAGVAADIWVESIPFKETRNYVQNVLVYDAIYQHFISRDRQPQFLSGSELRHRY